MMSSGERPTGQGADAPRSVHAGLDVRVLGPLEVRVGGDAVRAGSRKQRLVLLRLVVARGRAVSSDELAEAIWPDDPPGSPSASLRAYVSNLRGLLGSGLGADDPPAIERRSRAYVLRLPPGCLDVERFEADLSAAREASDPALRLARAERALAHWRGPPLSDAAELEFALAATRSLSALRSEALELRIDALSNLGRHAEAVAAAEDLVAEHALDETSWEQLMLALYRSGRQADALRAFGRARAIMRDRLGVEPGPRLRDVERRILEHDLPGVGGRLGWTSGTEPLVGRDEELAAIGQLLDQLVGGAPRIAAVVGDPGAGKTRLVEVALERFGGGVRPVRVRCDPTAAGAGLLPLLSSLRELLETMDRDRAEQLLDGQRDLPWGLVPWETRLPTADLDVDDAARFRLFAALVGLLGHLAEHRPLVLVVDDLHWAGPRLVEFLVFLAARQPAAPIAVIVTLRPGEVTSASGPMTSRLVGAKGSVTIAVQDLDLVAVATLVRDRLGGDVPSTIAAEVHRRSGGNAYFAVELIRAIDPEDPGAFGAGSLGPGSLREVIASRVSELPGRSDELITVGALCGTTFDLSVAAAAAACPRDEAVDVVDAAIATGLLREVGERPGHLEFRHALVRDAVEQGVTRVRRAHWHARIGEVLLARGATDDPAALADLAAHLALGAMAGTGLEAGKVARSAIDVALARHESEVAGELAERGLDALGHAADGAERRRIESELWCDLATARKRMADVTGSHDAARRAFSIARDHGELEAMARAALCLAGGPASAPWQAYWTPAAEAVELLEATLDPGRASDLEPTLRVLLLSALASARSEIGSMAAAWAATDEAIALARDIGSPEHLALAVLERWRLADLEGTDADRRAISEEVVSVASSCGSLAEEAMARRQLVIVEVEAGDHGAAVERLEELATLGAATGSEQIEFDVAFLTTALALLRGELAEAERSLTSSLERFAHLDQGRLDVLELQLVRLLYERAALDTVEDRFRERLLEQDSPALRAPLLLLLAEHDRTDEARRMLATMPPSDFEGVAEPPVQFVTLCVLADAVAELDAAERAVGLAEVLEPLADRMISLSTGVLLNGWVALPLARLLAMAGRCDEADRWASWAADRARAVGSAVFELRARVALAEVDLRRGDDVSDRLAAMEAEATSLGYAAIAAWARRLNRRAGSGC